MIKAPFVFPTNAETYDSCVQIYDFMSKHFGISMEEAIGRMNQHWRTLDHTNSEDQAQLFHEEPEYWACAIYLRSDVIWWHSDLESRRQMPAKPYP